MLWIPGRLPGMNDVIGGQNRGKNGWNPYNAVKTKWASQIKLICQANGVTLQPASYITMLFIEPNRRRDPDNIISGGQKVILDSLVKAGVLAEDGWDEVLGLTGYWTLQKDRAGCLVHLSDKNIASKGFMLALLEIEPDAKQETWTRARAGGDVVVHEDTGRAPARKSRARG